MSFAMMAQRENALSNSQALFREPMSFDDYLNSRMISDPIRLFDCVMPCSGGECVILASEERAKQITDKLKQEKVEARVDEITAASSVEVAENFDTTPKQPSTEAIPAPAEKQ